MEDFFSQLRSEDKTLILFLFLSFLAGMVVWLTLQWRLHRRTEMEMSLKREMVSRGMSAEDIERVLRASSQAADGVQSGYEGARVSEAPPLARYR